MIIFLLPAITVFIVILLVKEFNQGVLIIHNVNQSVVTIKDDTYIIDSNKYEIPLWASEYPISIKKTGYESYNTKVTLTRGQESHLYPDLKFIPIVENIDSFSPYKIPDEYKLRNEGGDIVYHDNQALIGYKKLKSKILNNMPADIMFVLFSPNGEKAIIITGDDKLDMSEYYLYDIDSESLIIIEKDIKLSGISWSKTNNFITYLKPKNDNDGTLYTYNVNTLTKNDITDIYGLQSIYSAFTLDDSHIVILPNSGNRDLIDVEIESQRKNKITFRGDIKNLKSAENGIFYSVIDKGITKIKYLDLRRNNLYELPIDVNNINKIGITPDDSTIIYSKRDEGLMGNEFLDLDMAEELTRAANIVSDSINLLNLRTRQSTVLKSLKADIKLKSFLNVTSDGKEITFLTENNKYIVLTLDK